MSVFGMPAVRGHLRLPARDIRALVPYLREDVTALLPAECIWGAEANHHEYETLVGKSPAMHVLLGYFRSDIEAEREAFGLLAVAPLTFYFERGWNWDPLEFLLDTLRKGVKSLQPGGVAMVALPQGFEGEDLRVFLAGWFEGLAGVYVSDTTTGPFKDWIVVFGVRRARYQPPTNAAINAADEVVKGLKSCLTTYNVPSSSGKLGVWRTSQVDPLTVLDAFAGGASLAKSVIARGDPQGLVSIGAPPLSLKQGHLALLMASGRLDGVIGRGKQRHVLKGRVQRKLYKADPTGTEYTEIQEERFDARLVALTADGDIVAIN